MINEIIHPVIDPSKVAGTIDGINYINTITYNLFFQIALIVIPLFIWLLIGFGSGRSKTIRLKKPNYYIFLILIFIQAIILAFMDFGFHLYFFN